MQAHTAPVADVTFDASGGYFATASACREVKVWDTDSGLCTHCLLGHTGMVMRVLFHPSQPLMATSGDDGVVNLWDLKSKNVVYKLTGHVSAVSAIAWASDGAHLVSGGRDKVAILWDTRTGTKVRSIAVLEAVETLVVLPHTVSQRIFAPDSNCAPSIMFATGGEAGVVKFWSAQTGRCVVNGHVAAHGSAADAIVNLAVLSQSQELMCATADCTMAFMSVRGRCLTVERTFLGNLGEVTSAVFLESSASPMQDEASGCLQESLQGPAPPGCVAVATNSKNVFLLSSKSFACLGMFEGHRDIVLCIAAHCFQRRTDPVWLIASGSKDNTVRLWHVSTGRCLAIGAAHLGSVTTVSFFSQQSPSLLSGGADKLIQMWDLSCLWEILQGSTIPAEPVKLAVSAAVAAHEKEVNCVAVSPSNAYAASGGADRNARVWKLPALSAAVVLSGHRRGVWDIQFAPVDQVRYNLLHITINVMALALNLVFALLNSHQSMYLDCKNLFADLKLYLQAVLTASADATLRIWSVKDGLCIRTFLGHGASILHARFSAEGLRIVSGGTDGLLKGWNAQTGQCLFTEEAHDGKIWALDVGGAHQSFVVSGADDGSLVVWGDETKADADAQRQKHEHDVQELQVCSGGFVSDFIHALIPYIFTWSRCRFSRMRSLPSSMFTQPSWRSSSRSHLSCFRFYKMLWQTHLEVLLLISS